MKESLGLHQERLGKRDIKIEPAWLKVMERCASDSLMPWKYGDSVLGRGIFFYI